MARDGTLGPEWQDGIGWGLEWHSVALSGRVQPGVARCGPGWHGAAWSGVWSGTVRPGMARCSPEWQGGIGWGLEWHDVALSGTVRPIVARSGTLG